MTEDIKAPLLPPTFDQNPELKAKLEEYLRSIPEAKRQEQSDLIAKYAAGEMTWAEIKNVPQSLLKQLARVAYTKYKVGDLKTAELLFKCLSIVDHTNWYYRAALGTIFQKQGHFDQAIEEFNLVQEICADEVTSLVNRGICFAKMKDYDAALEDFTRVSQLPLDMNHPWVKKARMLSHAILTMEKKG